MPWWLYPLLVYVAVMAVLLAILGAVMFGQWKAGSHRYGCHDINQAVSACALGGEWAHLGSNARRPLPNGCQPGKLEVCTGACTRRPAATFSPD